VKKLVVLLVFVAAGYQFYINSNQFTFSDSPFTFESTSSKFHYEAKFPKKPKVSYQTLFVPECGEVEFEVRYANSKGSSFIIFSGGYTKEFWEKDNESLESIAAMTLAGVMEIPDVQLIHESEVYIDGVPAVEFVYLNPDGGYMKTIVLKYGVSGITIIGLYQQQNEHLADEFIRTFKFIS